MKGARYALALAKKIRERGYDAVTLVDVDGMKKLLGYPPAIVFMLLEKLCCVMTTPENDVLGNATQLMLSYLSGQNIHYMEYYEFFEDSMLIGTPDYIPASATKGEITMLPTAFETADLTLDYTVEEDVKAPVAAGDVLGKLTVTYGDKSYDLDLVAASDVSRSTVLYILDCITGFFTSTAFKIILAAIVALIIILVIYTILINRRRAKRRRRRR